MVLRRGQRLHPGEVLLVNASRLCAKGRPKNYLAEERVRVVQSSSVVNGILDEAGRGYDLVVIGASEEWSLRTWLFGSIPDAVAERAPCSVLLVKRREPALLPWFRRAAKWATRR